MEQSKSMHMRIWQGVLVATVAAVILNLIVFNLFGFFGLEIEVTASPGSTELAPLSIMMVIMATIVPAIAAGVIMSILSATTKRPAMIFAIIAVVVLLLSFFGPVGLPVGTGAKVALVIMHIVPAVVITWTMWAIINKSK